MKAYKHFKTAVYLHAYDIQSFSLDELERRIRTMQEALHLDKIYI